MPMDHLFLEGLLFQSSCSKDGIDDWKNSKVPYYSKFQSTHILVQLIFDKALRIFKVDLYRSNKRRYQPRLQYYNSPLLRHFYSISGTYQHFEVGHRYVQLRSIIWAQMGVIFQPTQEFQQIYQHYLPSHKFYSSKDKNQCYYCALLKIKIVFLPLSKNLDDSSIYPAQVSTKDLSNYLTKFHRLRAINIFSNYGQNQIQSNF